MPSNITHSRLNQGDIYSLSLSSTQILDEFLNRSDTCSASNKNHVVELMQVASDPSHAPTAHYFHDATHLSDYFIHNNPPNNDQAIQIIFLHQENTWAPLDVSKEIITTLMTHFNLGSGYLQVLSGFRDRCLATEEAFSGAVRSTSTSTRFELGYVYKYSEKKEVKTGNPWRIRHTGMYHTCDRHDSRSTSTFVIVSPAPNSRFEIYLKDALRKEIIRAMVLADPVLIHTMLLSTHLGSWREYLERFESLILRADLKITCATLGDPLVNFETLKDIRAIDKALLTVHPILKSLQELFEGVGAFGKWLAGIQGEEPHENMVIRAALHDFKKESASYHEHTTYLSQRCRSTAQSISDTLNLNFQQLAKSQSQSTNQLAEAARKDSVAIKTLTFVTSCYLPFSFVATVLGMNLISFDSRSRNLLVSNQFWLYFAISIPLTVLTLALWRWRISRDGENGRPKSCMANKDDMELEDMV